LFPWHAFVSLACFHFLGALSFLFPSQALGFLKAAKICFLTAAKLCFLDTLLFLWHAFVSLALIRFLGALSFPWRAFLFPWRIFVSFKKMAVFGFDVQRFSANL